MDKLLNRWFKGFMVVAVVALIGVNLQKDWKQSRINKEHMQTMMYMESKVEKLNDSMLQVKSALDSLRDTHPYMRSSTKKGKWRKTSCASGAFFGFLLYTPVDTSVSKELILALSDYKGPKAKVNSLRRHYNQSSQHFHGKAVDLAWNEEVIDFLVSAEGQLWLQKHGITFYIEGVPGSKRVKKYLGDQKYSKFVFFNEHASGDHIHLNV